MILSVIKWSLTTTADFVYHLLHGNTNETQEHSLEEYGPLPCY